jgi:hypothetical protein
VNLVSLATIIYKVKPGYEDEIADVFANFERADSPILRNPSGEPTGLICGTWLFIQDSVMVRVIEYEGQIEDVARHMAAQPGVHQSMNRLVPFLRETPASDTADAFIEHFGHSLMRCIQELSLPPKVLEQMRGQIPAATPA